MADLKVEPARAALVKRWIETVKGDREHWKPDFDRMDECIQIAAEGADKEWVAGGKYVVPIVNRHINQAVATLYARHPKVVAKNKSKLMYRIWDGDPASILAAQQAAQQVVVDPETGAPVPADPNAVALLQEIEAVKRELLMRKRMGRTMELLFDYFLNEQDAGYRPRIKGLVRRAKVVCVGYLKLGFQRELQRRPDVDAQIADVTEKISSIEALMQKARSEPFDQEQAEVEDLRLQLESLQAEVEIIAREGPVLSFPDARNIIPDRKCTHLKTFAGCGHVAQEFDMTPEEVLEIYGVDVKAGGFEHYRRDEKTRGLVDKDKALARVWEVQDKHTQQVFVVCDGYPDFLREPAAPDVRIERFWTLFPLVFNEAEGRVFPISDVWAARHMQRDYNNAREGLRNHRVANQPKYLTGKGKVDESDIARLASAAPHEVIPVNAAPGERVGDLFEPMKHAPIDPALYETESTFQDVQRAVGSQEANIGGTSGATATESSIAENSRMTASADNVDDLDTMLTEFARAMGQLMLLELDVDTVTEIAGPGAVWPKLSREQVAKELFLEIEAGSSGRPNKAAEMANLERAMPYVIQIPGFNPLPLGKKYAKLLDLDIEDAFVEGLPSIVAMNQAAPAMGGGDPATDPRNQGGQGADNAPQPGGEEPGGQPAFPGPAGGETPQRSSI